MSTTGLETDKRVQRSKAAVLKETYALLSRSGIGGLSIDEVSRRSGVSKTTIYRHWPSRSALLLDACSQLGQPVATPDTGSLHGDLRLLTEGLAQQLQSKGWATILPSIIDAAERDSEVAQVHAAMQAEFTAPFLLVAERAQERGELPSGRTPPEVVAAILGPLYYRRWFSKEVLDEAFVARLLALL